MKTPLSFLFFVLFTNFVVSQKSLDKLLEQYNVQSIPYISVEELRMQQLKDTVVILDTREPNEFYVSHLKTAKNVGYNNFSSEDEQLQNINKATPIVVYCSVGIRSEKIGEKLKKAGFTNVKNLYGGIFTWKHKGYQVIDTTGKNTENIHAFSRHWSQYLNGGNPVY